MNLLDILASEPLAEDLVVLGAGPVRALLATGEITEYPRWFRWTMRSMA